VGRHCRHDRRHGSGGGLAYLVGSPGNDVFVGTPGDSVLYGNGFFNEAIGFPITVAASGGGNDTATLYGRRKRQHVRGHADRQCLERPRVLHRDARLPDQPRIALPRRQQHGILLRLGRRRRLREPARRQPPCNGNGFFNEAIGFPISVAASGGGNDTATLYGAAGANAFVARPNDSALLRHKLLHRGAQLPGRHAVADPSANNVADLYDLPGDDLFFGQGSRPC